MLLKFMKQVQQTVNDTDDHKFVDKKYYYFKIITVTWKVLQKAHRKTEQVLVQATETQADTPWTF